jgi:ATP-dependent helicase/DNAse subunit B
MSVTVITGPAASGKTQWLVDRIKQEKQKGGLRRIRVIIPEQRHKKKFQERLIAEGGMLGVFIDGFNAFCRDLLLDSGNYFPSASLPLKHRVLLESIHAVNSFQGLGELSSLIDKSGFISLLHDLFRDLQQAGVDPGDIHLRNWKETNQQIGVILDIYQEYLHTLEITGWLDENSCRK